MKRKLMIAGTLLLASTLVFAGGRGGGKHGGKHHGSYTSKSHGLYSDLNLTSTQLTEIETLKTTLKTNIEALALTPALKSAVASGSFDSDTFIAASIDNHTQVIEYIAQYKTDFFALLTDTQKSAYIANIEDLNITHKTHY
jgi:hypothetical protein